MAARKVDPLKAKAAKQKKIAIGGFVVLALVLAVQGPKTLKMLKGPQPEEPVLVTPAPVTTPGSTPPIALPGADPTGAAATGATPPVAAVELASVPDSDQAPVVDEGQLATFERFSSKDPFAQQAVPVAPPTPAPAKTPTASDPAKTPTSGSTGGGSTDGGFTTGGTNLPAAPAVASTTSVAVNGVAEDVKLEVAFPTSEPTFILVSVADDGKSVEIGINGGQYASGGDTLKLLLGKKLTLQNTADGSRFELELLSIAGFPLPKQKG
ncbi:MAG TPA: hypothetical protein VFV62_00425 [Gaiellaceae bacterium]|nr:hypothetical protein [Gaiellaceae bacterium]